MVNTWGKTGVNFSVVESGAKFRHLQHPRFCSKGFVILPNAEHFARSVFRQKCLCIYIFIYLYIYIFLDLYIYIFVYIFFCYNFFKFQLALQISFSAIVLKVDMYTRERDSVRRTKFRRSKVKVTRRSNIKINETLSF